MRIEFDHTKLLNLDITVNQFTFLYLILKQGEVAYKALSLLNHLNIHDSDIKLLVDKNLLIDHNMDGGRVLCLYELTDNFKELFKDRGCEEWIDDWRKLFPTTLDGRPKRGDKQDCIKKMNKFMLLYPQYDKDFIFTATAKYIRTNQFLRDANFFIDKLGAGSMLLQYCELLMSQPEEPSFHKVL